MLDVGQQEVVRRCSNMHGLFYWSMKEEMSPDIFYTGRRRISS